MKIGEAAEKSGLPAKTIRYYEDIGLVQAPARTGAGYRDYDVRDVQLLKFVHRSRSLGFTVDDCRELMALYLDHNRASADVKSIARARVQDIDAKIAELQKMRRELEYYMKNCNGDDRPDCPIIDLLASPSK